MKRTVVLVLAVILLYTPAALAGSPADDAGGYRTGPLAAPGSGLPDYVGMIGYAVISSERAKEIEEAPMYMRGRLWTVPFYRRSGSGWAAGGAIPHKTEVVVREQALERKGGGAPDGYLLAETPDGTGRFWISVSQFLPGEMQYKAENGVTVHYYLYLPDTENGDIVGKLPLLIYFHGVRDTLDKRHGLGEALITYRAAPAGIVILPQAVNNTDADFHRGKYQDAVIELAKAVAAQYNGDMNRLSVSGHSDGGSAAYQIVNGHPGVFAACAPVAAIGNIGEGIRQTWLWVFQGEKDFWVKPHVGLRVVKKCESAGGTAMHYVYENEGHEIQTRVFLDTFTDENGREVKLADWLMSKKLNE